VSNDSAVVENGRFSAFSPAISSETLDMRPTSLYSDTQSVVGFSVIPKCVTLNDLGWLFSVKLCFRAILFRNRSFQLATMKRKSCFHRLVLTIHEHVSFSITLQKRSSKFRKKYDDYVTQLYCTSVHGFPSCTACHSVLCLIIDIMW